MHGFKQVPNGPNQILKGKGFYISYVPPAHFREQRSCDASLANMLAGMATMMSGKKHSNDGAETALNADGKWMILKGDYRKDYAGLVKKGKKACIAFYLTQKDEAGSEWSTD